MSKQPEPDRDLLGSALRFLTGSLLATCSPNPHACKLNKIILPFLRCTAGVLVKMQAPGKETLAKELSYPPPHTHTGSAPCKSMIGYNVSPKSVCPPSPRPIDFSDSLELGRTHHHHYHHIHEFLLFCLLSFRSSGNQRKMRLIGKIPLAKKGSLAWSRRVPPWGSKILGQVYSFSLPWPPRLRVRDQTWHLSFRMPTPVTSATCQKTNRGSTA